MSKMNCCPGCPLHYPEAQQMPDLHSCVGALADELLDVLDEADWDFTDEEDDE